MKLQCSLVINGFSLRGDDSNLWNGAKLALTSTNISLTSTNIFIDISQYIRQAHRFAKCTVHVNLYVQQVERLLKYNVLHIRQAQRFLHPGVNQPYCFPVPGILKQAHMCLHDEIIVRAEFE